MNFEWHHVVAVYSFISRWYERRTSPDSEFGIFNHIVCIP